MKIHRFIDGFDLSKKQLEIGGEIAHQIYKVLRLKVSEKIELCDGKGTYAIAEIAEIKEGKVSVNILEKPITWTSDVQVRINLFCAVLKKENFELVVQKSTECGVTKIVPIITSRTIKTGLNLKRLQKIAKEASEQCGRITIPEISEPIDFDQALELAKKDFNILFDASGELLGNLKNISENVNIFIGPEGGWAEEEIAKAKSLNFKIASLGPLILRGETAAIVATYLVSN